MYLYIQSIEKETFVMNRCQKLVTSARSRAYAKGKVLSRTGMNNLDKIYADRRGRLNPIHPIINDNLCKSD